MTISWVWDARKAAANALKHGISFELAARVFDDPFAVSAPDPHPDGDRWRVIGCPEPARPLLLLVVHSEAMFDRSSGQEVGRIISARRATPAERKLYAAQA